MALPVHWAPALDNTTTTTYTFTPTAGQCAYDSYTDYHGKFKYYTDVYGCCANMFWRYINTTTNNF